MADKKFTVVLTGEDGLSQVLEVNAAAVRKLKGAMEETSTVTSKFNQVVKEERAEGRMRNFAIRETAAGVQQLSNVFVGPSGLGNAIGKSAGAFFELDFALKSIGAVGSGVGGVFGKLASGIGAIAGPAAIAIGAFALIKSEVDETDANIKKFIESNAKLRNELIGLPTNNLDALKKKVEETTTALKSQTSVWEKVFTTSVGWKSVLDKILGTNLAMDQAAEDYLEKENAVLTAKKAERDEILKIAGENVKLAEARERLMIAEFEMTAPNRIAFIEGKVVAEKAVLSALESQLVVLNNQKAPELDRLAVKTKIAEKEQEIKALEESVRSAKAPKVEKLLPADAGDPARQAANMAKIANSEMKGVVQKYVALGVQTDDIKLKWEEIGTTNQIAFEVLNQSVYGVAQGITQGVGKAWNDTFGEANSLLEIFLQKIVEGFAAVASQKVVSGLLGGLLSFIPGGGVLSSLFGGLFHSGGTVPKAHSGAYINAPASREFPIMVRGGETIRTEDQEREIQTSRRGSGGTTINLNVGTAIGGATFVRDALSELRRQTGLSVEQLTQNRTATVRLGTAQ